VKQQVTWGRPARPGALRRRSEERPASLGMRKLPLPTESATMQEIDNGIPYGYPAFATLTGTGLRIQFGDVAASEFSDAFSAWTVDRLAPRLRQIDLPWRLVDDLANKAVHPHGVILQVSRCGSTLLSQLLKEAGIRVYSEPMAVNGVLDPSSRFPEEARVSGLRAISTLLSRHAGARFCLKLRSWNCLYADVVKVAFPDARTIFCTRNPLEVAVSALESPPTWLRAYGDPANPFIGIVPQARSQTREVYIATLLAAFHDAVYQNLEPDRTVEYSQLPEAAWDVVAPLLSLPLSSTALGKMRAIAGRYSKARVGASRLFEGDVEAKQAAATPLLRQAIDEVAMARWRNAAGRVPELCR